LTTHDRRLAAIRKMFDLCIHANPDVHDDRSNDTTETVRARVMAAEGLRAHNEPESVAHTLARLDGANEATFDHLAQARLLM